MRFNCFATAFLACQLAAFAAALPDGCAAGQSAQLSGGFERASDARSDNDPKQAPQLKAELPIVACGVPDPGDFDRWRMSGLTPDAVSDAVGPAWNISNIWAAEFRDQPATIGERCSALSGLDKLQSK